jgi:hypothetical protein
MDSGKTLAQEITDRTGRTAKARPSPFRWARPHAGVTPFGPEDIIRTEIVDALKHGDGDDDQLYLDQRVSTATGVNPFTRIGRITTGKMRDFITLYDISDYYFEGQVTHYQHTGSSPRVEAATSTDDPDYVQTSPAPLSEVPTATSAYSPNASKPGQPRTVGAGFIIDQGEDKGKLTIVFRDGTYYNYYDVPHTTWETFKSLPSKGAFIKSVLDGYERGPATDVNLDPDVRQELYKILMTAQQMSKGRRMTKRQRATETLAASPKRNNPTPKNSYRVNKARTR